MKRSILRFSTLFIATLILFSFAAVHAQPPGVPPGGQKGPKGPPPLPSSPEFIKRMDKNGDGKVSQEEFPRPLVFKRLDRNGDGFIEESEMPTQQPQSADKGIREPDSNSEYTWPDYRQKFDARIIVCHDELPAIKVDLPESFITEGKEIPLMITVTSLMYADAAKAHGATFNAISPFIRLNNSWFSGTYSIPVSDSPATQTHQIMLKSKDLKPGVNKIQVSLFMKSNAYCSSDCCGMGINNMYFKKPQ